MSKKREPEAVIGYDDYMIVKFTHDVELARELMRTAIKDMYNLGDDDPIRLDDPYKCWVRIVPCLPSSYGYGEYRFEYQHAKGPGRGAFPAVIFS